MDAPRFDELTRVLARPATSRRSTVRLLGGGALVALLARLGRTEAAATCVRLGKTCKKGGNKLKCCGGAKCRGKTCKCPGQTQACRGKCIPDASCCCTAGESCQNGTCFPVCANPITCGFGGSCGPAGTNCRCANTVAGNPVCIGTEVCAVVPACSPSNPACPAGRTCVELCCGGADFVCAVPCAA